MHKVRHNINYSGIANKIAQVHPVAALNFTTFSSLSTTNLIKFIATFIPAITIKAILKFVITLKVPNNVYEQ